MGVTKTIYYTSEQNELAAIAKALAHPARIAIIDYLLKVNKCICKDIVNELSLAQPTISQHLKELKSVGLIQGSIEGTAICYCINHKTVGLLQAYILKIATQLKCEDTNCC